MKAKRILLITRYFPPLDAVATNRMYGWAKYLTRQGHHVFVLTTSKKGQVVHPYKADLSGIEVTEIPYFDPLLALGMDKTRVIEQTEEAKIVSWKGKILSFLKQFYRERMNERLPGRTDGWIYPAVKELRRRKKEGISYDVIISSYGPPAAHLIGYFAKKIMGCPWFADYRDPWIENYTYRGIYPFIWLEKWLEKKTVGKADRILTVSEGFSDIFRNKFPSIPVHVITNGFDPEIIDQADPEQFFPPDGKFRIVHTGSLYKNLRNPAPLFRAIHRLPEGLKRQVEVLFYGHLLEGLKEVIEQERAHAFVQLMGSVSQIDSHRAQKGADRLLFLESPNPHVAGIIPAKVFEYLYVDTPILGIGITPHSPSGQLICDLQGGEVCEEDEEKIHHVLQEAILKRHRPEKKREAIWQYSREMQVKKLLELIG